MEQISADEWNARATPAGSPTRISGGRMAQAGGRGFEGDLEWTHDIYRRERRADIFRLPVNTAPMPRAWVSDPKRSGICRILSERQRADYFGTMNKAFHSRAIAMEAKFVSERKPSLAIVREGEKGAGLKMHQLEHLVRGWTDFGCLGVLVWKNGTERLMFMPPLLVWAYNEVRLGKIRRLQAVDAVPYLRGGIDGSQEDWLSVAEDFLRTEGMKH